MTIPWLPDWYKPGLPIAEAATKALLAPLFPTGFGGAVQVEYQLPDAILDTGWAGRMLFVARFGGAADVRRDQAAIQLSAITNSQTDSQLLNGFVRDVLLCIDDDIEVEFELPGGLSATATIVDVREITGPEEVPGLEYDERIVPSAYMFTFDNPLETPDYSDHLGL